ncbi:MAG: hypothetical protein KJZ78_21685, partial [Bryobacteraceae bacterium]|nr:hypothetical protein [Bryobacteraceae bacterium]
KMIEHLAVTPVDLSDTKRRGYRPAVIFGHRNKLTADGPFLDLLQAFVQSLEGSTLLTIVGYSFGDGHINALIARWLNGNTSRRLRIVNRSYDKIESKFTKELRRLGTDRVDIVTEDAATALAKIYENGHETAEKP